MTEYATREKLLHWLGGAPMDIDAALAVIAQGRTQAGVDKLKAISKSLKSKLRESR